MIDINASNIIIIIITLLFSLTYPFVGQAPVVQYSDDNHVNDRSNNNHHNHNNTEYRCFACAIIKLKILNVSVKRCLKKRQFILISGPPDVRRSLMK
jgi:hypothetical protein